MREAYFKLAKWDDRQICFSDGRRAYPTEEAARGAAKFAGRYRISKVTDVGRIDFSPFDVAGPARPAPVRAAARGLPSPSAIMASYGHPWRGA